MAQTKNMLEALSSRRVVFPFLLLLAVVFLDHFFVRPVFTELDTLEHFIFGFVISEAASRAATSVDMKKWMLKSTSHRNVPRLDLFIRLAVFLAIGGLLWESLECFLLPALGWQCNSFFAFPITLHNIDGAIDVAVGILGCMFAWSTAE